MRRPPEHPERLQIDREADRVREAYARRAALGLDARYNYWKPANLYVYQSRERVLLDLLRAENCLPLTGQRILDIGCGDGAVLRDLLRYGARPADLHGVDLLPERVERARELTPDATIELADAQRLPFDDGSFDLAFAFTLLSSVTDDAARRRIIAELRRVLRSGGLLVVYDFRINPLNRDVRPLKREDLQALFPGCSIAFRGATLAPPLVRLLVRVPGGRLACAALEMIPFLQTHYLAAVHV